MKGSSKGVPMEMKFIFYFKDVKKNLIKNFSLFLFHEYCCLLIFHIFSLNWPHPVIVVIQYQMKCVSFYGDHCIKL